MHARITDRCNMLCKHCCYSSTTEGKDMSYATFRRTCELAVERKEFIEIGGGEPLLHPEFWLFIELVRELFEPADIFVTTNGKITRAALELATLAHICSLQADLSIDKYHEPIERDVYNAFTAGGNQDDGRGIRDVTHGGVLLPAPFGRAIEWVDPIDIRCPGNGLMVEPNGLIYACGCREQEYGTVFAPRIPHRVPNEWCSRKLGWIEVHSGEKVEFHHPVWMKESQEVHNAL